MMRFRDAFATGNPFLRTKLLVISIGRKIGARKELVIRLVEGPQKWPEQRKKSKRCNLINSRKGDSFRAARVSKNPLG